MAQRQIRVLLAAVFLALALAAMLGRGTVGAGTDEAAGAHDGHAHDDGAPCHEQVTCGGQVAGVSPLPLTPVVTALGLLALASATIHLPTVRWRDRLASGRLFRPPRLLV